MKKTVFTGAATALVTPLTESGIDFENFGRLIDFQIENGIDALVAVGTTGEGSTLDDAEHKAAIKYCVERVAGRVPVIAGTGSNDINYAVELTKYACAVGADAMLLVTPYYNKATQTGMELSFLKIAEASSKPCILYNVPSRTGVNIGLSELAELSKIENIVGIKEASDSADRLAKIAALGDALPLYAGNDSQTYTALALGGAGVISVLSNLYPERMRKITDTFFAGRTDESLAEQLSLLPLIDAMFLD